MAEVYRVHGTVVLTLWLGVALVATACEVVAPPRVPRSVTLPPPAVVLTARAVATSPTEPQAIAAIDPTPTPMTYVVKRGDTLSGIAVKYGVTVEALQIANGGVAPEALQIGQVLIVPARVGSGQPAFVPEGTPLPIEVRGKDCFSTPVGGWWCLGEVRNTTGGPVTNVAVQIAMSAPGESGTTATAFAALDFIPPGASVPFGALFAGTPSGTPSAGTPQSDHRAESNRTYKTLLLSAESADGLADRYAWFDVADTRLARAGELITLAGTVRNDRSDEVNRIVLVATVYDAVGQVTGFRIQSLAGSLPTGGSLPFEIQFSPAGGEAATFAVVAQGRRASP